MTKSKTPGTAPAVVKGDDGLPAYAKRNGELVEEFLKSLPLLSPRRVLKYRTRFVKVSRELEKPFDEVTKDDLRAYVTRVNENPEYAVATKLDYRIMIKKFFRWLHNQEFVEWIRSGRFRTTVGPEDILSEAELNMMRETAGNPRDRALVETLYESAFRPQEFLSLRKDSVSFDEYGASIHIEKGKTGPRRVRVVNAAPLLAAWIETHPVKKRDAPLWVDVRAQRRYAGMKELGLIKAVDRIAKRARVEKDVYPYVFRHTRLTNLANHLTEAQLCEFAGWEQGSEMPMNYVHLSGRDVDEALLRTYGIGKKKEEVKARGPKTCPRCGTMCSAEDELCRKCGMALNLLVAMKKEEKLSQMEKQIAHIYDLLKSGAKVDPSLLDVKSSELK
ncbi:MAG: tyrosine-type recombinase/integrase [Nitrososphaerota archaeon]|jgi:integrase|nr:tyrosine-type recombinase/integrase [Nitrososphaerota archaeon]